jgi:hypothetical protein
MKKKLLAISVLLMFIFSCVSVAWAFTTVSQIIETFGSVSPIVGNSVIYSQNDKANMYARFYNTQRDQLWDENATAMGAGSTVTWANSAVSLTDWEATRGGWKITVPATLTEGWYDVTIYDNAAPAAADTLLVGRHCYIKGGSIQSLDDL